MVVFGLISSHFVRTGSPVSQFIGAPVGLIPCPSLSLVIGGLSSRGWSLVLAVAGLFYGVFGATRLGVRIDLFLLAGAAALLVVALLPQRLRPRRARAPMLQGSQ
jgi:hypothetical protein